MQCKRDSGETKVKPLAEQMVLDLSTAAAKWDADATKRTLDELFISARRYRTSGSYLDLMQFVRSFHYYSPYNAMLVHIQMPGAKYVATASRWRDEYGRCLKPGAKPLVILRPMGPVMFVFDVSDTEEETSFSQRALFGENRSSFKVSKGKKKRLPPEVENPFAVRRGQIGGELDRIFENAKRDGIRITWHKEGSQAAGSIHRVDGTNLKPLMFTVGKDKHGALIQVAVKVRYDMLIRDELESPAQYATATHELAHLYCGHIGTPNAKWWPDRRGLSLETQEFEAESVSYLLCGRIGIESPADEYLSGYFKDNQKTPDISIECIMKAAGLIEQMGKSRMMQRKQ